MTDTTAAQAPETKPETVAAPSLMSRTIAKLSNWFARRRFGPVVTTIALICIVILIGLGTWQLQRLQWKNSLLAQAQENFKHDPIDLRKTIPTDSESWQALHYKPVVLKGHWLTPFHAIKMAPRTLDGEAGYQLIIPLQLSDNQIVLVNRGFAPDKVGVLPPEKLEATIHGVAYLPETVKPPFMPENVPSRGVWVWPDMLAMGHEVGRDGVAPVMIFENRVDGRDDYPIGGQLPLPGINSHRQYAVTWYALALALLGVWLMASNPKPETAESTLASKDKQAVDPVAQRGMYPEATD